MPEDKQPEVGPISPGVTVEAPKAGGGVETVEFGKAKKNDKTKLLTLIEAVMAFNLKKQIERWLRQIRQKVEELKGGTKDNWLAIAEEHGKVSEELRKLAEIKGGVRGGFKDKAEEEKFYKEMFDQDEDRELAKQLMEIAGKVRASDKATEAELVSEEDRKVLEGICQRRGVDKNKFLADLDKERKWDETGGLLDEIEAEDLDGAIDRFNRFKGETERQIYEASKEDTVRERLRELVEKRGSGGPTMAKEIEVDWNQVSGITDEAKRALEEIGLKQNEIKSLDLGGAWKRYCALLEKNLSDTTPDWYRNLRRIEILGKLLKEDEEFKRRTGELGILNKQKAEEVDGFIALNNYRVDLGKAEYQQDGKKFNWLLEEHKLKGKDGDPLDKRLYGLWMLFKDRLGMDQGDAKVFLDDLIYLSQLPSKWKLTGSGWEVAKRAAEGLNRIDELKVLRYVGGIRDVGERERVKQFLGDLRFKLEHLRDKGEVPLSVDDVVAQREAQKREEFLAMAGLGGGGRKGIGRGISEETKRAVASQVAQQQKPPGGEGGDEGGGGVSGVYLSEKLYKELAIKAAEESPRAAVEHMMNFLITHDVGERDQYYLMSYVKNLIAGEQGPIGRTQGETWILSSVYAEWLNELELFRALPGITSAEQLMSIGHSISTGSLQDIMEYKKDFSEWGGVAQLQITGDGQTVSHNVENKPELKHFSVGGSDVEALFESDYWFKKFQYRGRGADMTPLREQILMEAMWLKLGGRASLKGDEKMYSLGDQNLTLDELKQVGLAFGNGSSKTFQELAEENLWLGMVGEMNWELTGKRPEQNKYLEGRRTIYNWDKFFQYDVYAAKYGMAQGFDFFYSGYEEGRDRGVTSERKPLLDLKRNGFVSARAKSMIMAYLFSEGDKSWPDKDTGKTVMVKGLKSGLANDDEVLAKKLSELFEGKFFDSRDRMREMEVFRHMFDSDEELKASYGVSSLNEVPRAVLQLRFTRGERELLNEARWDKLFAYLLESGNEGKISADEFEYFIAQMGGGKVDWIDRDKRKFDPTSFNVDTLDQEKGAELFFKYFNRRWMFWEKDEHDRMLKENYYTKQAAEIASKMVGFAKAPTVDNLLNYIGPICAYQPNNKTQELAYRNMDMVLEARKRFNLKSLTAQTDMRAFTTEWEEYRDMDGYPMPQRRKTFNLNPVSWVASVFIDPEKVLTGIAEKKKVGVIAKEAWENGVISKIVQRGPSYFLKDYWKEKGQQLEGSVETVRTFLGGAAATKGWSTLDAWGRKNAIEKLWHTGTINWWQKEKLMAKHVAPAPVPIISAWLAGGLDVDLEKGSGIGKLGKMIHRAAALGLYYLPSKLTTWAFLNLWIHDWGKAQASFWNEIVAPAMFGESAKAVQVKA